MFENKIQLNLNLHHGSVHNICGTFNLKENIDKKLEICVDLSVLEYKIF